ncbi:MAG: hypothetical protein H6738_06620 [Alphaproteobacteria bacterium]|nr:hypothetical protein [Alphaproteobacteria bacterium]MCB9696435.1 hypothetical protein [Alphaproteobacteria bacterium]
MPTELHDIEALEALAEGGGVPADWANVRLALRAPDRVRGLPTEAWDAALCLYTGARGATDGVLAGLGGGRKDVAAAAESAEAMVAFGLLPEEACPWVDAARGALRGDGRDADVLLASLLADLGALDQEILGAAVRAGSDGLWFLLPRLVLGFAEAQEPARLDEVAAEVAAPLAAEELRRPGIIGLSLARMGVPVIACEVPDADLAVAAGERVAGNRAPSIPATRGSARRRARRLVTDLLRDVTGPAAALMRALARIEEGPDPYELVAAAAWLAARPPADPLHAVLRHGGGEDARLLARARSAMTSERLPELVLALEGYDLRQVPAVALTGPWLGADQEGLLDAVTALAFESRGADRRADVAGCAVMARRPDLVVELLADRASRDSGLMYARYASTEEVLGALLEQLVPAEPASRRLYAWALCDQADRAAFDRLEAVAASFPGDEALGPIVARGRALLGG